MNIQDSHANKVNNYYNSTPEEEDILQELLVAKLCSPFETLLRFPIDLIQGFQRKSIQLSDVFKLGRIWCYTVNRKKFQRSDEKLEYLLFTMNFFITLLKIFY